MELAARQRLTCVGCRIDGAYIGGAVAPAFPIYLLAAKRVLY